MLSADNGDIRRAYNVSQIEISPVAVSQDFSPAGTTSDIGDKIISINSVCDLFEIVKQYGKDFSPKPVNPIPLNEDGTPKMFYLCTLHVVVCQQKIMTEVLETAHMEKSSGNARSRSVNVNVAQFARNINPESGDLLRYLPDDFLNDAQKTAKYKAILETLQYTTTRHIGRRLSVGILQQ